MKLEKLLNGNIEVAYELQGRRFLHLSQNDEYVGMIGNMELYPITLTLKKLPSGSYSVTYQNCVFMCNVIEESCL